MDDREWARRQLERIDRMTTAEVERRTRPASEDTDDLKRRARMVVDWEWMRGRWAADPNR